MLAGCGQCPNTCSAEGIDLVLRRAACSSGSGESENHSHTCPKGTYDPLQDCLNMFCCLFLTQLLFFSSYFTHALRKLCVPCGTFAILISPLATFTQSASSCLSRPQHLLTCNMTTQAACQPCYTHSIVKCMPKQFAQHECTLQKQ